VIVAPKVVTVTFAGDALKARLEAFGDVITTTPWWDAVSEGYCAGTRCVGHGTAGGHVVLTSGAASYTDSQGGAPSTFQDMIQARVTDGSLPAPASETLYVFYLPSTTSVTMPGANGGTDASCQQFGGYHGAATLTPRGGGTPVLVPYAVIPRCDASERSATIAASHELIEAATDPDASQGALSAVGYYMMNDQVWTAVYGGAGEVADLCVDVIFGKELSVQESGFTVQRSWSNKAAKAGHNPCVPVPTGEVYFQAAPPSTTMIVPVGKTVTVNVDPFSDAKMADWSISTIDFAASQGQKSSLTLALDRTTVNNGTTAKLTVTMNSAPTGGGSYFAIRSTSKGTSRVWPVQVVTK
jgi:hypothetical protein